MVDIEKVLIEYKSLFGDNPTITKINVGFTNTIYSIDDKFILKICTNKHNEEKFLTEIEFYKNNKMNDSIPVLYGFDTSKKNLPYYFEIIEKVEGVSLYNIWHKLTDEEREEIIFKLTNYMKDFHSNVSNSYDWSKYMKHQFFQRKKNNYWNILILNLISIYKAMNLYLFIMIYILIIFFITMVK